MGSRSLSPPMNSAMITATSVTRSTMCARRQQVDAQPTKAQWPQEHASQQVDESGRYRHSADVPGRERHHQQEQPGDGHPCMKAQVRCRHAGNTNRCHTRTMRVVASLGGEIIPASSGPEGRPRVPNVAVATRGCPSRCASNQRRAPPESGNDPQRGRSGAETPIPPVRTRRPGPDCDP